LVLSSIRFFSGLLKLNWPGDECAGQNSGN
jgi:hypothetical protein